MKLRYLAAMGCVAAMVCCQSGAPKEALAESGRTERTENLLANMLEQADTAGYMFGHQDDPVYGIGWVGDSARSDVKSVCNDRPAVVGFDLGHLEMGDSVNLDGVPFARMREEILAHYDRGGVVTLSWHVRNPLNGGTAWVEDGNALTDEERRTVAEVLEGGQAHERMLEWIDMVGDFLNSLETDYGVKVPVIFRPWHEHTGSWFWWGQEECTREEYVALWEMTVERLRERGVTNALYAYSPGSEWDGDAARYLERYPGDAIIDVMGLDTYCMAEEGDTASVARYGESVDRLLTTVCSVAREHGKVAALTETGFESVKTEDWWTGTLAPALARHKIAYVLVWRNAHDKPGHYYAPYPGQRSAKDFVRWYNDPKTLFLGDVNGLFL